MENTLRSIPVGLCIATNAVIEPSTKVSCALPLESLKRAKHAERRSAAILAEKINKLRKLLPLGLGVTVADGFIHTVSGVVLQEFIFDLAERGLDRLDLGQDIDAVPAFL
jgi:hypothetical protein